MTKIKEYLESDEVTGLNATNKVIEFKNRNCLMIELRVPETERIMREMLEKLNVAKVISREVPGNRVSAGDYLVLITGFDGSKDREEIKKRLVRQNDSLTASNFIIQRLYTKKPPFTAILNLRTKEL